MRKLIIFTKKHISIIIIIVIGLIAIFPYLGRGYIIGTGEAAFLINPIYLKVWSVWNDRLNFGLLSGFQSNLVLFTYFWDFFKAVGFGESPSIVFIFSSLVLPGVFFYIMLDKLLALENKLIYLPGSLLYSLNVYRLSVSFMNINLNILLIVLPLFFIFYYNLLNKPNKVSNFLSIILLSFASSTMGGNLAVFTIPYILLFLYLIYYLITEKAVKKFKLAVLTVLLLVGIVAVNIFWLFPAFLALRDGLAFSGADMWNVIDAGTFFDHLRFMGFWAFKLGWGYEPYFPYYFYYYGIPLLFTTFLVPIVSLFYVFSVTVSKKNFKLKLFTLSLFIISFFMVSGSKGPFGFIYEFIYRNVQIFKIFREPYAKFMPIFIFASSLGLVLSFEDLGRRILNKRLLRLAIFLICGCILINVYPLFIKKAFYLDRWNQGSAGHVQKIPDYWLEASNYLKQAAASGRIFLYPYNPYIVQYNWEIGTNTVNNVAYYLTDSNLVNAFGSDGSDAGILLREVNKRFEGGEEISKYLGILGISNVLKENDIEWRYDLNIKSPAESDSLFQASEFKQLANFGTFTKNSLAKIPNPEPDDRKRSNLTTNLLGKSALVYYGLTTSYIYPQIYIPQKLIYANSPVSNFPDVVDLSAYANANLYYLAPLGNFVLNR